MIASGVDADWRRSHLWAASPTQVFLRPLPHQEPVAAQREASIGSLGIGGPRSKFGLHVGIGRTLVINCDSRAAARAAHRGALTATVTTGWELQRSL